MKRLGCLLAALVLGAAAWGGAPLRLDVTPACKPLKPMPVKGATPTGFAGALLGRVTERTGRTFVCVPTADAATAAARLRDGVTDLWADYGADAAFVQAFETVMEIPVPKVYVRRRAAPEVAFGEGRIAAPRTDTRQLRAHVKKGIEGRVVMKDDLASCFHAVLRGEVDFVVCAYVDAHYLVRTIRGGDALELRPMDDSVYAEKWTFRVSPRLPAAEVETLRRCLASLSADDCRNLMFASATEWIREPLLSDAQVVALVLAVLFLSAAFVATLTVRANRRVRLALAKEQRAARAQASFLATMSHEIRTPLNAVLGFADRLAEGGVPAAEVQAAARSIGTGARAVVALLNDVLDYSKLEAGHVDLRGEGCSPAALQEEVAAVFRASVEAKGVALVLKGGECCPRVPLNETRLRQILFNLVGNAIKFTDRGTVGVEMSHVARLFRIVVSDTGCGISPEALATIFEPYVQDASTSGHRMYKGTGLGLAIVKGMVEAAGGTVRVASRRPGGRERR